VQRRTACRTAATQIRTTDDGRMFRRDGWSPKIMPYRGLLTCIVPRSGASWGGLHRIFTRSDPGSPVGSLRFAVPLSEHGCVAFLRWPPLKGTPPARGGGGDWTPHVLGDTGT